MGKLADFVVIPFDYMAIPAEDIWKIETEMTVIGGEVVYTRPVLAKKMTCPLAIYRPQS
jgi:predicted amidohydrolase YtcJ